MIITFNDNVIELVISVEKSVQLRGLYGGGHF